ncbi:BMA-NHR-91, isoform b [Aphelenchoides bicaudatus]|nr:BMA-NHR-91, isoform b [Aphelenchoides bicaudatus]
MQPDTSNDQHCKPSQAEYQHLDAPIRKNLIQELIEIDRLEDLINLRGLRIHNEQQNVVTSPCQRLSKIGDEIVEQLVEWTKLLPFYAELPVEIHTLLLTQRWAELVLLSACFYAHCTVSNDPNTPNVSFSSSAVNLQLLQQRLSAVMNKEIPLEHVQKEAGPLVEKFTDLLQSFSRLRITLEAYVCLKAITLLHFSQTNQDLEHVFDCSAGHMNSSYQRKVSLIQDQFVKALQIHMSQCYEDGPRLSDILTWLPMLHSASSVLLHSKMFYVPFLICKQPEHLNDSVVPRPIQANPIPKTISTSSLKLEPEETDCSSSETSAMRDHSMAQDS